MMERCVLMLGLVFARDGGPQAPRRLDTISLETSDTWMVERTHYDIFSGKEFYALKKASGGEDDDEGSGMKRCESGCAAYGGTLACIENKAQQDVAKVFADSDQWRFVGTYQIGGAARDDPEAGWRWTSQACEDSGNDFTAWRGGEPQDYGICKIEQCAAIGYEGDDKWVDVPCGAKRGAASRGRDGLRERGGNEAPSHSVGSAASASATTGRRRPTTSGRTRARSRASTAPPATSSSSSSSACCPSSAVAASCCACSTGNGS